MDCPLILHGGVIVEPRKTVISKKRALGSLVKSLVTLKQYAVEKGIEIWLENLSHYPDYKPFHYMGTTVDEFAYVIDHLSIPIFFDFGHANVNAQCSVEEFFIQFHQYIVGVSMSNNSGKLDQHLSLNKGSLDYHSIVKTMLEVNWQGIIGFETRNTSPSQSISELQSIIDSINLRYPFLACEK